MDPTCMDPTLLKLPASLAAKTKHVTLGDDAGTGGVPAMIVHPDGTSAAPVLVWIHGRTAFKELDNGRYLRLLRKGIASVALDLPGHGERSQPGADSPTQSVRVITQMIGEIDAVVDDLTTRYEGMFDPHRMAIGGMSAGGMATLRRLCDPHPFCCAHVEGTTGLLCELYHPPEGVERNVPRHDSEAVEAIDASAHLEHFRPIPMQVLHTKGDRIVPYELQERFVKMLGDHYEAQGAERSLIRMVTYENTGAPEEHGGFGRFGNDAKNTMTEFLVEQFGL